MGSKLSFLKKGIRMISITTRQRYLLFTLLLLWIAAVSITSAQSAPAPSAPAAPDSVLFTNVRIFDGTDKLTPPSNVLVTGNHIAKISTAPIASPASGKVIAIDGAGRTLMPGLIDAHTHIMLAAVPQTVAMIADLGFLYIKAGQESGATLMRGFTTIRDLGGPAFGLKLAIDQGVIPGPRIYPSGAFISQTGGHGDFRWPYEVPKAAGDLSHSERGGVAAIADSPDEVRLRAREQLRQGATQIKLMAGGGVASPYDPLDVTQYTEPEFHAAVEAAENWGTYVTVHAYTPRAIRIAIDGGVKCIEHGQLADESTAKLMADKGIWWSLQPFLNDEDMTPMANPDSQQKQLQMVEGTDNAYKLAKKYKVKTAFGTDTLFSPTGATRQNAQLAKLVNWYSPAEVLKMATADNAELLALSGPRNPYPGKLGVVQEGALADLLLVDGDPVANIKLITDPEKNFVVIMKDGKVYKNTVK